MKFPLIAKIGIGLGILGGAAGLTVAIISAPLIGSIMALIFIVVFGWVYLSIFRPMIKSGKLLKTGLPAEATVLKVWDTGVTVNNSPQIGMLLEIRAPGRSPYQAEIKQIVSRLQVSYYQPGQVLTVRYDPDDIKSIAIESIGSSGSSGSYSAQQLSAAEDMLRKLDEENKRILSYGESSEAVVLAYNEMGINVNGNNPAVRLDLEVRPKNKPKFRAEAKGVIAEASISKFQAGESIWVKFDPNDFTKVTIERS
jgi:hypothetical protein